MNKLNVVFAAFVCVLSFNVTQAARNEDGYWNCKSQLEPMRLPLPPKGYEVEYIDLNGDGKPDAIKSVTINDTPVLWLDDDGNMKEGDLEGDMVNDCLLIDRNKDGFYGGQGDLIIDWVDSDNDGKADLQFVIEYPKENTGEVWPNGHYMIMCDLDKDNVFNYINWNDFSLRCWDKYGVCDFYEDYSGQTMFMKIHTSTYDIKDLRLNWENPFLFYDEDGDGLTEIAIRFVDSPKVKDRSKPYNSYVNRQLEGRIDWVSMSVDIDNDNAPGNEFDYDFTIGFQGDGFGYADHVHKIGNLRGLPEADKFFMDPHYRQLTELLYVNHDEAKEMVKRGKWSRVNFVYDEDDDCGRWERVEFYDPLDPFKVGWNGGGIDNNKQSDVAGDRGEWDMDNSGGGQLYVSRFDGRLHLYGADWGCWRIDQNANYYQGWDRMWLGMERQPAKFATVRYTDKDGNGFFDYIEYDLDGDKRFETVVDLHVLGIDDKCEIIDISAFKYKDYTALAEDMSDAMWNGACKAVEVARRFGVETLWYAKLMRPMSTRQKYNNGYWLQFYLYNDMRHVLKSRGDDEGVRRLDVAYYSGRWDMLF